MDSELHDAAKTFRDANENEVFQALLAEDVDHLGKLLRVATKAYGEVANEQVPEVGKIASELQSTHDSLPAAETV